MNSYKYFDVTNNFDLQYFATKSLRFTARFGFTNINSTSDTFYPSDHLMFSSMTGDDALRKGSYTLSQGNENNISGKFDVQYNKEIMPKHYIYMNAGFDISQRSASINSVDAEGFPSEMMTDIMFARQYTDGSKPYGSEETVRDFGYYLSLNYSYDERINFDATFRQSASSMYGANSRWGAFWSVGAAWNIQNENWFDSNLINLLRLRASVGSTGSQSSAAYSALATYNYFMNSTYEGLLGAELASMKNDDLMWQQKDDINFGVEMNLKNRFSLTFDYYVSTTSNTLNPLTLAPSTGFSTVQENAGKVENKGFDARLSYTVFSRPADRTYFTVFTSFSRNKNTLIEISDALQNYNDNMNSMINSGVDENGNALSAPILKYYDGVSMDAIWAMQSLGIDPATGNELYLRQDADGNYFRSFEYDANSQIVCGNMSPDVYGNIGANLDYKGLSLSATLSFKFGGQMYNTTLVNKVENANLSGNVDYRIFSDRWREPGDDAPYKKIQNVTYTNAADMTASSQTLYTSRFVQDNNELNISSVQVAYDFYRFDFVKKLGLERVRLALNMNDVATFSTVEIERGTSYPFARVFNGSLTLTF